MKKNDVIAVFDIGKTNKKILLFDETFNIVYENETRFDELKDDDGFECDDIEGLIKWMNNTLESLLSSDNYNIVGLNFSTYGATMVFLDENGNRTAPVYNYLKPMPDDVMTGFYEKYGGVEEFSRKTASPALGMLNSGLQIYFLKKKKPELFINTKNILHLPQYLSFLFTGKMVSEYTSIGCHTALWDFDNMIYHQWLADEGINLPEPVNNSTTYATSIKDQNIKTGIGIHDSSASLVPYLKANPDKQFLLISSGTWAINMNPFSKDPLTADELRQDCLCYMSVDQNQVKSSRLFLGHIHEINAEKISQYFNVPKDEYKRVRANKELLKQILNDQKFVFFPNGVPENFYGSLDAISQFQDFHAAYHQLVFELSKIEADKIKLVFDKNDTCKDMLLTGGFVRNDIFTSLIATLFPGKDLYTANIENTTALGAAMVIAPESTKVKLDLNLQKIQPI